MALRTVDNQPFAASGLSVTLAIGSNPGAGVLHGTTTVTTDAAGVATFNDLSISAAGAGYTLTATSAGLTGDVSTPFGVLVPPILGAAQGFSLLAVLAVVNTGVSRVSGDVGVSPGSTVSGFGVGAIGGDVHANDATSAAAQSALVAAYADLSTRTPDAQFPGELSGLTFGPGVYHSTAAAAITTSVTLDAHGDPKAVFIFQTGGAFDTAANATVILANGALAANVYWVAVGAAGTGANTVIAGNILSLGAITLGAGTTLIGRALSRGTVTLTGSTVRFTTALPPTIAIDGGATATTKDTTPTISGSSNAASGSPVTVTIAGQTLSTTVGSDGRWGSTATVLIAGSYPLVARVRDAAGNGTAASATLIVEVNPDPVNLGAAAPYAVLGSGFITSTFATVVNGDLGVSPGSAVGFPPGLVNGNSHIADTAAAAAQVALAAAISDASGRRLHTEIAGDLGGQTFHIGVHHSTAALALTGNVTLDAEGNANAVFIFQSDAAFDTAAASTVTLANGAQAANVYWVVVGATGTGANSSLAGTILCSGAITLGASTQLTGRALARGAVTLAGSTVTRPGFAPAARRAAPVPSTSSQPATSAPPSNPPPSTPNSPTPTTTTSTPPTTTSETSTTAGSPPTTTDSPAPATTDESAPTTADPAAPSTSAPAPTSTPTTTSTPTATPTQTPTGSPIPGTTASTTSLSTQSTTSPSTTATTATTASPAVESTADQSPSTEAATTGSATP